ncbi:TrmH family RNA methyltransferase [Saccharicrinis sp. GN24d3]|uniref:TrmH family RNA methyltransferase n=1 Tax=Saccharicrinis sp. GN24d3 TaxID=3458416 RepID=UPI0040351990
MKNSTQTKSTPLFATVQYSIDGDGPILVADQLKSPENMGHIIRLASNFGCAKVIFIGDSQSVRHSKIKKVAGAAAGQIEWQFCKPEELKNHLPEGYTVCAIETTDNSLNLSDGVLPEKVAFVLGNEIHGVSAELMEQCSHFYHIPMIGAIKSMNVSHACSVALYEWVRQYLVISPQ